MSDTDAIFHRTELAARFAARLLGRDSLEETGRSGIFMSAPRRTGKSTFLKADLVPQVEAAGAIAVYQDLWEDTTRDPAELIAEAIGARMRREVTSAGRLKKMLSDLTKGSASLEAAGFKAAFGFERQSIGKVDGVTLTRAFRALHEVTGKQIVFILDEAQNALTTEAGTASLFALKAARDDLNITSRLPQLAIVATGSARGKISNLVMRKSQAFFGATVAPFPTLDEGYVAFVLQRMLGHRFAQLPSTEVVMRAFKLLACRPEDLQRVIRDAVVSSTPDLGDAILETAARRRTAWLQQTRQEILARPAVEQAILYRLYTLMSREGDDFEPFTGRSLKTYEAYVGRTVTKTQIQRGLAALVRDNVLWRSARGDYEIDDEMVAQHFRDIWEQGALGGFEAIPEE